MQNRTLHQSAVSLLPQSTNPIQSGEQGIYVRSSDNHVVLVNHDASTVDLTTGGVSLGNYSFTSSTFNLPANALFTGASSATNTTGLTITSNVTDGASSIGIVLNNTASLTSGKVLSVQNASTELWHVDQFGNIVGTATMALTDATGTGIVGINDSIGSFMQWGASNHVTVDGSNVTVFAVSMRPQLDNNVGLGDITHRWEGVYSSAAISGGYRTSATPVTATAADWFVGVSGTGSRTVALPAASTMAPGQALVIQDVGPSTGTITISPAGSDDINGANSAVTISGTNYGRKMLICDGVSNWFIDTALT